MTCLQAFLAGFVLGLGLARVSPSGKARASQARMRGFESRHPLQDNLKPAFERTTPHGWLFVRRRAFLIHELKNFRRLCKIYLATAIHSLQKQKSQYFCNFFSIRDSLPPRQSENRPLYGQLSTFSRPDPRFGATRQSLIAKKLQSEPIFCFQAPMTAFGKAMGETARAQCCRWSGLDAMLWGAIRTQRRKAAAGRYGERCGKAAPGTHPSLQTCGPKRKRRPHKADAFA